MAETFEIPLSNGEIVEIGWDQLPDDVSRIIDLLKNENVPLRIWRRLAVGYYKLDKVEQFETILKDGINDSEGALESKDERVAILNTLASHYTRMATLERDKETRARHLKNATKHINMADKIDIHSPMTWMSRGAFMLAKGGDDERTTAKAGDQAMEHFENCLKQNKDNIPALLGMASLLYHKGEHKLAFERYKRVMELNPHCTPRVRLGIGLCLYQMGHFKRARQAFERTLELDPSCVEALVALGLLDLNDKDQGHSAERIKTGTKQLEKAFRINKGSAMVLNHLSNYFFFKDDYEKVLKLAHQAMLNTDVKRIKAESLYSMARAYHAQGEYESAQTYYRESMNNWSDFPLPLYGLALMALQQEDTDTAIGMLEKVNELLPDNFETTKLLGILYGLVGRQEKAEEKLNTVTELWPMDSESWVEKAHLLIRKDVSVASTDYENALKLSRRADSADVSMEMWNNLGVLRQRTGKLNAAMDAYENALKASGTDDPYAQECVTVSYNMGRLYEDFSLTDKAEGLYKGILKAHPNYIDCYLRLGMIKREAGDMNGAADWFKEAIGIKESSADAWSLWGNLHVAQQEWQPGQKKFERVIKDIDPDDNYSQLALGTVYYQTIRPGGQREAKYLEYAMTAGRRVLKRDPKNAYAANLCGTILCEKGYLDIARDIFTQVREASGDMPDVMVNLAHLALNNREYEKAISLYESCLRRFYRGQNVELMQFAAFAYFEANKLNDCITMLNKAVHIEPHNSTLRYNLAIAQYNVGSNVAKSKTSLIMTIRRAAILVKHSSLMLQHLLNNRDNNALYVAEHVSHYLSKCTACKTKLTSMLASAEQQQRRLSDLRLEKIQKAELERAEERAREEEKRLERERQLQEEHDRLMQSKQRLANLQNQWEVEQAAEANKPTKEKKGDSSIPIVPQEDILDPHDLRRASDSSSSSDDEPEPEAPPVVEEEKEEETRKITKRRKRQVEEEGGVDDDDDEGKEEGGGNEEVAAEAEPAQKRQRKVVVEDEDDDDENDQ